MTESPSQTNATTPQRPRSAGRTLLELVAAAIVACVLLVFVAPITGMGSIGPILFLFFFTWILFGTVLYRAFPHSDGPGCLLVIGSFFLTVLFYVLGINGLIAGLRAYPPPRPMFHNYFGEREQALLPAWNYPSQTLDEDGKIMWADYEDNVLVVVSSPSGMRPGFEEAQVILGEAPYEERVVIQRTTNALIVIRADGRVASFPLPPDVVRDFHEARQSTIVENLLIEVQSLLDADSRAELKAFIRDERSQASSLGTS